MNINRARVLTELVFAAALATAAIAGCGEGSGQQPAATDPTAAALSGKVHGGNNPVTGANVVAYAAGDGNSGSSAIAVACVQTDSAGNFAFDATAPTAACTAGVGNGLPQNFVGCTNCPGGTGAQIYLAAIGGNPGLVAGTNNTALTLLAALGPYSGLMTSGVDISELTTVAATYSLAQMMGSGNAGLASILANDQSINAQSPWLGNSFSRALSLVNAASKPGAALSGLTCTHDVADPVNCGALEKLDTLADALASCVNAAGPSANACQELFCDATPGASYNSAKNTCSVAAVPSDTLQSALSIALNPGTTAIADLYTLAGVTPPFAPTLNAAPNDWTLALNIAETSLGTGEGIAIDGSGNAWVASVNPTAVTEISPLGAILSPEATGFSGGGLGIAIDPAGNVWAANGSGVTELSSAGAQIGSFTPKPAIGTLQDVAIDGANHVWLTTGASGNSVAELDSNGKEVSGTPTTAGGLDKGTAPNAGSAGIALDTHGRAWIPNSSDSDLTILSSGGVAVANGGAVLGAPLLGAAGLGQLQGISFDPAGNAWINDSSNNALVEVDGAGTLLNDYKGIGGLAQPLYNAVDSAGNVWVSDKNGQSITEISNAGIALSTSAGFQGGGISGVNHIALDGSGDVWVTNTGSNSVVEFIGAAAPVKTPLIGLPVAPGTYPVAWLPDFAGNLVRAVIGGVGHQKTVILDLPASCTPNGVAVNQGELFVACLTSKEILAYPTAPIKSAANGTSFNSGGASPNLAPTVTMINNANNDFNTNGFGGLIALAFDAQDNLWFSDNYNGEVGQITASELHTLEQAGGSQIPSFNTILQDSPAQGIAFDTDGSMWQTGNGGAGGVVANFPYSAFMSGGNLNLTPTYCVNAAGGCPTGQSNANLFPNSGGGDPEGVAIFNGVLWVANNGENAPGYELLPFTVFSSAQTLLNFVGDTAGGGQLNLTAFGVAPSTTAYKPFACPGGLFATASHLWLNDEGWNAPLPAGETLQNNGTDPQCSTDISGVGAIFQFTQAQLPSPTAATPQTTATPLLTNVTGGVGFGGLYIEEDQ